MSSAMTIDVYIILDVFPKFPTRDITTLFVRPRESILAVSFDKSGPNKWYTLLIKYIIFPQEMCIKSTPENIQATQCNGEFMFDGTLNGAADKWCCLYKLANGVMVVVIQTRRLRGDRRVPDLFTNLKRSLINALDLIRNHFGYGLSQWETTLHSNVVSHWLTPYPEWSLFVYQLAVEWGGWSFYTEIGLGVLLW